MDAQAEPVTNSDPRASHRRGRQAGLVRSLFVVMAAIVLCTLAAAWLASRRAVPAATEPLAGYRNDRLAEARALAEAERLLEVAAGPPPATSWVNADRDWPLASLGDAERGFHNVIASFGPSPRALRGLARVAVSRASYEEAASVYRRAVSLDPASRRIGRECAEAAGLASVARGASRILPAGHRVLQLLPLDEDPGARRWAVLSAVRVEEPEIGWSDARLTIVAEGRGFRLRAIQSRALGGPLVAGGTYSHADAYRVNAGSDSRPEILTAVGCPGAGWAPTDLECFAVERGALIRRFVLSSCMSPWIEDLDGDGAVEIGTFFEVGEKMAHAGQPRWSNIYSWDGTRPRVANRRFPDYFRGWPEVLRRVLDEYPDDWQIWKYLAISHAILGDRQAAERALERARRLPGYRNGGFRGETGDGFWDRADADASTILASLR